nr:di-heme oxidoredictase family protein [Armatimonas sp.]
MKKRLHVAVTATLFLGVGACGGMSQVFTPIGAETPGLTRAEQELFEKGKTVFASEEDVDEGLGPVFNGRGCGECHSAGGIGGAGEDLVLSRVTRIGAGSGASYSDLVALGGPVIQRRSIAELDPTCTITPEVVPAGAEYVSRRITTPLFGAGLMEAIPDSEILKNIKSGDPDGITGIANYAVSPITGQRQVGRFGWKSQVATLEHFAADAYLNEMGITTPVFSVDLLPQGKTLYDVVPEPEDDGEDLQLFADFMRLLAAPDPAPATLASVRGSQVFTRIRCAACHIPTLQTGNSSVAALANRPTNLYSDLLTHDLGAGLGDGVVQGSADGRHFRTAPLWGLRLRQFFLHDGRATTPDAAIREHGGEATAVRLRYQELSATERAELLEFLGTL